MKKPGSSDYDFSFLRQLRNEAKVSLDRLVEETGISFSTLTRIESNQNKPNLTTLSSLAKFFGLSPAHMVELATSNVIAHVEEELEDLGDVRRRGVSYPDAQVILGEAKAGEYSERHRHDGSYQILWVLEGRLKAQIGDREFELDAGQAIRFGADLEHKASYQEDTRYIVVLVPKRTR